MKTDIAESKAEYIDKLSVDILGRSESLCFQGTVDNMFSGSNGQEKKTNYNIATVALRAEYYSLTLDFRKAKLDEEFQNNLEKMDAFRFYDMYGAYFISGVTVGGTIMATFTVDQIATFNQEEIESSAMAAFKQRLVDGKIQDAFSCFINNSEYKCSKGMVVNGGNPNLLNDVSAWSKSVFQNPCVIDWKLEPMYELLDSKKYTERKNALMDALKPYFDATSLPANDHLKIDIFTSVSEDCVVVADGWKLLNGGASSELYLTKSDVVGSSDDVNPTSWTATATSICKPWKYKLGKCDFHRPKKSNKTNCFAVAVYDPANLLEVMVFVSTSESPSCAPSATATVPEGYIMVGGGATIQCDGKGGQMLIESYPSAKNKWSVKSRNCHIERECTITAHAIGIKWRDPTNKPELISVITYVESPWGSSPSQSVAANGTLVGGGARVIEYKFDNLRANMLTSSYLKVTHFGPTWTARSAEAPHCRGKAKVTVTAYAIGLHVKTSHGLRPFASYQY